MCAVLLMDTKKKDFIKYDSHLQKYFQRINCLKILLTIAPTSLLEYKYNNIAKIFR